MNFLNDCIHLTQGELLIKYWYVFLAGFILISGIYYFLRKKVFKI